MHLASGRNLNVVIPGLTALLFVAITAFAGHTGDSPVRASFAPPSKPITIAAGTTASQMALAASKHFYRRSPVVIVASADPRAQQLAARAAGDLRVPALIDDPGISAELKRLRAARVLTIGEIRTPIAEARTKVATTPAAVGRAAEVAREDISATPGVASDALVLSSSAPRDALALATARSAGATVVAVPGADPRTVPAAAGVLRARKTSPVLALGDEFSGDLSYTLAVVRSAPAQLGGGTMLFPGRLMVALYGHPGSPSLGVLGEKGLRAGIARAKKTAASYQRHTKTPVIPTFEIITTIASASPGKDKDYSAESSIAKIRPWVEAANKAGVYVVLDLQPGRSDFLTQAKRYESLLKLPHVGLALDPEWRLTKKQKHLRQIGSVSAAEVNRTSAWLAALTRKHALPQKVFVLHQFSASMIRDRAKVDTSHPELSVLIHVDGHGTQPAKQGTWKMLHKGAPQGVFWGWKNFYDEDDPMLTAKKTLRQVEPFPQFISYQ